MPENRFPCGSSVPSTPRDLVCIETNRILDSCRDRDCFEDVRVILTDYGNDIIDRTTSVRVKDSCITSAYVGIDPVRFNRGFYSVTVKFYIKLLFEACVGGGRSQEFDGIAVVEKNVVLYGGDSNVNVFKSNSELSQYCSIPEPCCKTSNVPVAVVETVEPIILGARVAERRSDVHCICICGAGDLPERVSAGVNGVLDDGNGCGRHLLVSIGLFSVIRIVRPAQYLINATEYSVPDKECACATSDDPCAIFSSMPFPTSEFSPQGRAPSLRDNGAGKHCCGS